MRAAIKKLEIYVRGLAPAQLRAVYRMVRPLPRAEVSKPLPADLIRECSFCASRYDLLDLLPHRAVVAELGTYKGRFARRILARTDPQELHLIDIDYSRFDESLLADARVRRHQGLTDKLMATFPDGFFDWVYVDADHSYEGTLRDARASAAKVRPGGFLVFNDFAHIDPSLGRYGVHRAVVDFAVEMGWSFRYFAYQRAALYDVALRKPG